MMDLTRKFIFLIFILLKNPKSIVSRISTIPSANEFTNLVFQPRINSPKLPPDTLGIELIEKNGYPLEIHDIITEDGYILNTFRIPCGRSCITNETRYSHNKPPVFLFHPFGFTADVWLYNQYVNGSLAFVLADAGYDVWLGNMRGTHYSNKHVSLTINDESYWNFSIDEYGKFDLPATIKYILEKTGKPKLHFIALSFGAAPFFSAMSTYAELNEKIALHISYGPFVFTERIGVLIRLLSSAVADFLQLVQVTGHRTISREGLSYLISKIGSVVCNLGEGLCHLFQFTFSGHTPLSREQLAINVGNGYTLMSLKGIIHVFQMIDSGEFREYDYGVVENIRVYGKSHPPKYNLEHVTAPVALIQAPYDSLATNESTAKLALSLGNVVDYYLIPDKTFTHFDYCCGEKSNDLVFAHTLQLLNAFS